MDGERPRRVDESIEHDRTADQRSDLETLKLGAGGVAHGDNRGGESSEDHRTKVQGDGVLHAITIGREGCVVHAEGERSLGGINDDRRKRKCEAVSRPVRAAQLVDVVTVRQIAAGEVPSVPRVVGRNSVRPFNAKYLAAVGLDRPDPLGAVISTTTSVGPATLTAPFSYSARTLTW